MVKFGALFFYLALVVFLCHSTVLGSSGLDDDDSFSGSGSGSGEESGEKTSSTKACSDDEDLDCDGDFYFKSTPSSQKLNTKTLSTQTKRKVPTRTPLIAAMATPTSSLPLFTIGQPSFRGNSYMVLPRLPSTVKDSLEILIRFKAGRQDGLLLYGGRQSGTKDFFSVGLVNGFVEIRFSNGADTVTLVTPNSITLGQWHQVVIFRYNHDGYVTLDYVQLVSGSTKKRTKLINLNTPIYIGGLPRYNVGNVPYSHGFHGCVKELVVDSKRLDIRFPGGAAKLAINIDNCQNTTHRCHCKNGGACQFTKTGVQHCACPLGSAGQNCEKEISIKFPSFNGNSHLVYLSLGNVASNSFNILVTLKPSSDTGLILLNTDRAKGQGDYFALSLREGKVEFLFDCGSGPAILRSKEPISIDQWHTIRIWRNGKKGSLLVDDGLPVFGESPGRLRHISLRRSLFIGGLKDYKHQPYQLDMMTGFTGCIQKVSINSLSLDLSSPLSGLSIDNCDHVCAKKSVCQNGGICKADMDDFQCQCPIGFTGMVCNKRIDIKMPSFPGQSYLTYPSLGTKVYNSFIINIVLRPRKDTGLVLYNGRIAGQSGDYISLALNKGFVEFRFDCGSGSSFLRSKSKIMVGQWHTISLSRNGKKGKLILDNGSPVFGQSPGSFRHLTLKNDLFLGGMEDFSLQPQTVGVRTGFLGCIQKVTVNSRSFTFSKPQSGANVNNCDHVCVTSYVCMNGGTCHAEMDRFRCSCVDGFGGMMCDREVRVSSYHFDGDMFATIAKKKILNRISGSSITLNLEVKTEYESGLIIFVHKPNALYLEYFVVLVNRGFIEVRFKWHNTEEISILSKYKINDSQWHSIQIQRASSLWTIIIDGKKTIQKSKQMKKFDFYRGEMYIGGSPRQVIDWPNFEGKLKKLSIGGHKLDITEHFTMDARRYRIHPR